MKGKAIVFGALALMMGFNFLMYHVGVVQIFSLRYRRSGILEKTRWLGVPSLQIPTDNWMMQEIIAQLKPDYIIETGTLHGGTTLFYAMVLQQVNEQGRVLTIDIGPQVEEASKFNVFRERVEVIQGSSVSPEVVKKITERVQGKTVLVTLDSDHSKEHVLRELTLYSPLVPVGSYIVVQDTNLHAHPLWLGFGDEPYQAVREFLKHHPNFKIDRARERFLLTLYPSGFLKRVE